MKTDAPLLQPGEETLLELKLDDLRRELATLEAPAHIEAELSRRFRGVPRASPRPRLWWMPPLALVATLVIVSWMVRGPIHPPSSSVNAPVAADDPGPFLALKPLDRIALEPGSTVVTTEFPRALLADWGLPVAPDRAAEPVRAEMLYSADGEPLAVRILN